MLLPAQRLTYIVTEVGRCCFEVVREILLFQTRGPVQILCSARILSTFQSSHCHLPPSTSRTKQPSKSNQAKPNIRISSLEKEKSHPTSTQLTMHLLPLLSTLLTLTAANPMALAPGGISTDAKETDFQPEMELQTVSDRCHLKILGFAGCNDTVLVDSNKGCSQLPKDKVYEGKTCGNGNWKVDTHSPISLQFQDIVQGETVACDLQPKGPLSC